MGFSKTDEFPSKPRDLEMDGGERRRQVGGLEEGLHNVEISKFHFHKFFHKNLVKLTLLFTNPTTAEIDFTKYFYK